MAPGVFAHPGVSSLKGIRFGPLLLETMLLEHRLAVVSGGRWGRVFAEPVRVQTAPLQMASGNFVTAATAAIETLCPDGLENLGLGCHGLFRVDAGRPSIHAFKSAISMRVRRPNF